MDDIIFEAVCNTVVEVSYLSGAGFLTRGLFSNNPGYIPPGRERSKNESALDCYELYRGRLVRVDNETEIYSASLKSPPGVRGSQLIYGECQPSRQWVKDELKSFISNVFPGKEEIRNIPDENKITALEFFSGQKIVKKMGKLDHLVDDLICSKIFENVPKEKLVLKFMDPGDSIEANEELRYAHSQWGRLISVFRELSIIGIKKDKLKSPKERQDLINKIKAASPPGGLGSVEELVRYWPPGLGQKPSVIFS